MSNDQLPQSESEMIDLLAKTKQLKAETDAGSIALNSHNSVDIQPSGTPFGTKVKVDDGNNSASLTFDSKKMRPPKKVIDFDELLDDAIANYETLNESQNND
jgi:hypothetical protein